MKIRDILVFIVEFGIKHLHKDNKKTNKNSFAKKLNARIKLN